MDRQEIYEAINEEITNKLYGTSAAPRSTLSPLTWTRLLDAWQELNTIYYISSAHVPKHHQEKDVDSLPVIFAIQIGSNWIAVLHPDYLPAFEEACKKRGLHSKSYYNYPHWKEDYLWTFLKKPWPS